MLFFTITGLPSEKFPALQEFLYQRKIKILLPFSQFKPFRFLTHHYIREKEVEVVIEALKVFLA